MPPVCASCGVATDRKERVRHREVEGGESGFVQFLLFLAGFLNPRIWLLALTSRGKEEKLVIELRRCSDCGKKPLVPVSIDLERKRMTFLVERRFSEALSEMRGPRAAAGALSTPDEERGGLSETTSPGGDT